MKPLHLSPSREAGAPAAEARAFVSLETLSEDILQLDKTLMLNINKRERESAQAKNGQELETKERMNARDSRKAQKSAISSFSERSPSFEKSSLNLSDRSSLRVGQAGLKHVGLQNEESLLWSKNTLRILL